MKMFSWLFFALFLITLSASTTVAQTQPKPQPQTAQTFKIGLVDTGEFTDEKTGIVKYINGMKSVEPIFKTELDALNAMFIKVQNLEKELTDLQNKINAPVDPKVPVNRDQMVATYNTKLDEYDKTSREYKFKQDDLKTRYQRRQQEIMGPILQDIGKALQDFAKQKGYTLILDTSKLAEMGALLAVGDEKLDLTKEFIAFYNARPAAATTK